MKSLLPSSKESDLKKGINSLELFLFSKGVKISSEFKVFRKLSALLGLIGAHTDINRQRNKLLEELGLINEFKQDNWCQLHRGLLLNYKKFLESLVKSLKEYKKKFLNSSICHLYHLLLMIAF